MTAYVQHYTPTATSTRPRYFLPTFLPSYISLSLSVTQSNSLFTFISLSRTHTHNLSLSQDFLAAVENIRPSVSPDSLLKYTEWAEQFGVSR